MSAVAERLPVVQEPTHAPALGWLRERGMGASVLVAALSSGFGVLLLVTTNYIGALLQADENLAGETLTIVVALLSVLLLGIAMYVAAIVTANTFSTIVAGRTRQIALMRLIGATAKSERKAIAFQGLGVGTIGAALGMLVATIVAFPATAFASSALNATGLQFRVIEPTLAIPAVCVALTTWAAAWAGSRRVLTVTPLQALSSAQPRTSEEVGGRARKITSVLLLVIGFAFVALGIIVGLMNVMGVMISFVGGLLSFTGMALGSTWIMPPVLRLIGRLFGSSAPAKLARENAMRQPERSSRMAIGVVMGVTLVTMFAVASASAKSVLTTSAGGEVDPTIAPTLDAFAAVMMALVGVSAVIAAVGLVNLLTIGVVQRRSELGLLRALGFTNKQVRRMILIEAANISIAALATGLLLGVLYGWAGAQATLGSIRVPPEYIAPTFVMPTIPWLFVLGVVGATGVLTLIASAAPTRLATRVAPVEAISGE